MRVSNQDPRKPPGSPEWPAAPSALGDAFTKGPAPPRPTPATRAQEREPCNERGRAAAPLRPHAPKGPSLGRQLGEIGPMRPTDRGPEWTDLARHRPRLANAKKQSEAQRGSGCTVAFRFECGATNRALVLSLAGIGPKLGRHRPNISRHRAQVKLGRDIGPILVDTGEKRVWSNPAHLVAIGQSMDDIGPDLAKSEQTWPRFGASSTDADPDPAESARNAARRAGTRTGRPGVWRYLPPGHTQPSPRARRRCCGRALRPGAAALARARRGGRRPRSAGRGRARGGSSAAPPPPGGGRFGGSSPPAPRCHTRAAPGRPSRPARRASRGGGGGGGPLRPRWWALGILATRPWRPATAKRFEPSWWAVCLHRRAHARADSVTHRHMAPRDAARRGAGH